MFDPTPEVIQFIKGSVKGHKMLHFESVGLMASPNGSTKLYCECTTCLNALEKEKEDILMHNNFPLQAQLQNGFQMILLSTSVILKN